MLFEVVAFLIPMIIYIVLFVGIFLAAYNNADRVLAPLIAFSWGWYLNCITPYGILDGLIFGVITLVLTFLLLRYTQTAIPLSLASYTLLLSIFLGFGLNTLLKVSIAILIVVVITPLASYLRRVYNGTGAAIHYEGPVALMVLLRLIGGMLLGFTFLGLQSFLMVTIGFEEWNVIIQGPDEASVFTSIIHLPYLFIAVLLTVVAVAGGIIYDIVSAGKLK